jgi:hypothetical protein
MFVNKSVAAGGLTLSCRGRLPCLLSLSTQFGCGGPGHIRQRVSDARGLLLSIPLNQPAIDALTRT